MKQFTENIYSSNVNLNLTYFTLKSTIEFSLQIISEIKNEKINGHIFEKM